MSKKQFLISLLTVIILISISATLLLLAQGYRLDFEKRTVKPTGILVVNSTPDGALIFLNDTAKDATNTSITSLEPGVYQFRLEKQGFSAYQREVTIQKERVTKVDALLIPLYPELKPLTFTGSLSPYLSLDGSKIVFAATQNGAGNSPAQKGLWLLDLGERPFNLSNRPSVLLTDTSQVFYSQMIPTFSPDSRQILLQNPKENEAKEELPKTEVSNLAQAIYFLDLTTKKLEVIEDATALKELWQTQTETANSKLVENLPKDLVARVEKIPEPSWSPDGTKILYHQQEGEWLVFKVFDLKPQDTLLPANLPTPQKSDNSTSTTITVEWETFRVNSNRFVQVSWYPDSQHLLVLEKESADTAHGTISILEIDGQNLTQIFSGQIQQNFLAPFPNGSKVVILTNFNPESQQYNLYSINLR